MKPSVGLRATVTASFAAGALALSTVLALGTYLAARHYLVDQRQRTALGQAFADASYVRDGLLTSGAKVSDVLGSSAPPAGSQIVLYRHQRWFSSSLRGGAESLPASVRSDVGSGSASVAWAHTPSGQAIVVGVPLPAVDAQFYEIASTTELADTLRTLAVVLSIFAALTTVSGALMGRTAARRLVAPLDDIAGAAARIALGRLDTRLPGTQDPDLAVIVGSFNSMVEALEERIQRDARFAADLSHELRSPLTTLMASVDVLRRRREELPERSKQALDLVSVELERLHHSLEDLLELGRLDAGVVHRELAPVDLVDLVAHALEASRRPREVLVADPGAVARTGADAQSAAGGSGEHATDLCVFVDKRQINRALVNLFDNADRHGDGLSAVHLERSGGDAVVVVDDDGPGVKPEDRQRIFERFARSGSRGSRPGTGLGLSLVAETVQAHGGAVWCQDKPGGGARFVIRLPLHTPEPEYGPAVADGLVR